MFDIEPVSNPLKLFLQSIDKFRALDADTLTLRAVLTVTSTTANAGFYGGLIIGDPPPAEAKAPASPQAFVASMASLGGPAAATLATGSARHDAGRLILSAPRTAMP